jgi:hypothetical protein
VFRGVELPSYVSYVDPVSGKNLANLNSQRLVFMRAELRDQLVGQPHVKADARYAGVSLTTPDAVDFALSVAGKHKA